jgi:hypothetical protein
MARSVNVREYAEKRNAILDVAARYITTKGSFLAQGRL